MATSDARRQDGFSLIELLVVILIIGILATIALPTFLNQAHKANDAAGKENTANLVKLVEACYVTEQDYTKCDSGNELSANGTEPIAVPYGAGPNQAEVSNATTDGFVVVGHSASGNTFTATRDASAVTQRTCATPGRGDCSSDGTW